MRMNAGAVALALSLVACPIGRTETDSDSSDDTDTTTDELPCAPVSSPCGPSTALVTRVIDGDTVELEDGTHVRYLNVDAPETSGTPECYGLEARQYNKDFVEGQTVCLYYDTAECKDKYDRLLAYLETGDGEINSLLVSSGHACAFYVPPSGADRRDEFESLEAEAIANDVGLWGACPTDVCSH